MQDKEFAAILQDEPMQPLALVPLTEEEQVCHQHAHTLPNKLIPANAELFQLVVISQHDTTSVPKRAVLLVNKCGCELTFLTFLPFCSFHSLSLSAEEFLHVCEQCGSAEAHGKRGGWGRPSWSGPRTRGHTRRSR